LLRRRKHLDLTGTPWSDDFMRQYAAALDRAQPEPREIGAERFWRQLPPSHANGARVRSNCARHSP
jgi:hypothetical protein